jgi:hypothetical protein
MMYFELKKQPTRKRHGQDVPGNCAKCGERVYESMFTLDDAYNVWAGKCPHCGAINRLGLTGLRGYSSQGMDLVLPTDEEKAANDMPADCPTSGSRGPATQHGSNLGELAHRLRGDSC